MAKSLESAEVIRRLAKQHKDMVEVAEYLESIGAVEQVIEVLHIDRERLRDEVEILKGDLTEGKLLVSHEQEKAAQIIEEAAIEAANVEEEATALARNVHEEAVQRTETDAGKMIADASAEVETIQSGVVTARQELNEVTSQIGKQSLLLHDIQERKTTAQAGLDAVTAQIQRLMP